MLCTFDWNGWVGLLYWFVVLHSSPPYIQVELSFFIVFVFTVISDFGTTVFVIFCSVPVACGIPRSVKS